MSYYNTNKETGETLKTSERKAVSQEQAIYNFMIDGKSTYYSPSAILLYLFGNRVPITSVRRGMTNLTNQGKLEKTDTMVMGQYGKMEHCWKIKENQLKMF